MTTIEFHPTGKHRELHFSGLSVLLNQSPAHYVTRRFLDKEKKTPALEVGRTFHYLLLECSPSQREDYFAKFWSLPEGLTLRHKKGKEFAACHDARFKLTQDILTKHRSYKEMILACETSPVVSRFLTAGRENREVKLQWYDPIFGLDCAGRADLLFLEEDGTYRIIDFKTTENCTVFGHSVEKYMYHLQAVMYREGLRFEKGLSYLPSYTIVALEKQPPYGLQLYELSDRLISHGYELYMRAAKLYASCLKTGKWPSYCSETILL
jgi:hypothetical protein